MLVFDRGRGTQPKAQSARSAPYFWLVIGSRR
jgi:hypothetical protein